MNDIARTTLPSLQRSVVVPVSLEHAFVRFTEQMGLWWPDNTTWTGQSLESIGIDPGVGATAWERGPAGRVLVWGKVLEWAPPHRFVLAWLVGPDRQPVTDPVHASEIEVTFVPLSAADTRVTVEHRGFERLGDGGAALRATMDGPRGWDRMLKAYAKEDGY